MAVSWLRRTNFNKISKINYSNHSLVNVSAYKCLLKNLVRATVLCTTH